MSTNIFETLKIDKNVHQLKIDKGDEYRRPHFSCLFDENLNQQSKYDTELIVKLVKADVANLTTNLIVYAGKQNAIYFDPNIRGQVTIDLIKTLELYFNKNGIGRLTTLLVNKKAYKQCEAFCKKTNVTVKQCDDIPDSLSPTRKNVIIGLDILSSNNFQLITNGKLSNLVILDGRKVVIGTY